MKQSTTCVHCCTSIPHSVWVCPACGGWVAETVAASTARLENSVVTA